MQRFRGCGLAVLCALVVASSRQVEAQCTDSLDRACGGTGPVVCVCWDNLDDKPDPVLDYNFFLGDPSKPGVELVNGRTIDGTLLQWRVWSQVSLTDTNPASLGSVKTPAGEDFDVKVLPPADVGTIGATSATEINLDPTDAAKFSNLSGAVINGDVNGAVFLQKANDASGTGGELAGITLIAGNVTGQVTIPKVMAPLSITGSVSQSVSVESVGSAGSLAITGSLSDNLTVSDGTIGVAGSLTVGGAVPAGKTVTIRTLSGDGQVNFSGTSFAGTMYLPNGIPGPGIQNVQISKLVNGGVVDVNNAPISGSSGLFVNGGEPDTHIIKGGAVSAIVYVGSGNNADFEGTATFSSVAVGGDIQAFHNANLSGEVNVTGSMQGEILVQGAFSGKINVGTLSSQGKISISPILTHAASGEIAINGNWHGEVELGGPLTSAGKISTTGSMKPSGIGSAIPKLTVLRSCDGEISIGDETQLQSRIQLAGGLGSTGKVKINAEQGPYNANGPIIVGPLVAPNPLNSIEFDGCIHVYENLGFVGQYGDLNGRVRVIGCHDDANDLNICADGDINGPIEIVNSTCTAPEPSAHSCNLSTCP